MGLAGAGISSWTACAVPAADLPDGPEGDAGNYDLCGWQRRALNFGNGYMGVSEFGDVATEKLQLSDPTFHTRQQQRGDAQGNYTDAADLFFEFWHSGAVGYSRELDLETAIVTMMRRAVSRSICIQVRRRGRIRWCAVVSMAKASLFRVGLPLSQTTRDTMLTWR